LQMGGPGIHFCGRGGGERLARRPKKSGGNPPRPFFFFSRGGGKRGRPGPRDTSAGARSTIFPENRPFVRLERGEKSGSLEETSVAGTGRGRQGGGGGGGVKRGANVKPARGNFYRERWPFPGSSGGPAGKHQKNKKTGGGGGTNDRGKPRADPRYNRGACFGGPGHGVSVPHLQGLGGRGKKSLGGQGGRGKTCRIRQKPGRAMRVCIKQKTGAPAGRPPGRWILETEEGEKG